MGTKNTVYLIAGGTNYYLSGQATPSQVKYAGSGTPWTVESTSPYELANNDVTGSVWVPEPAPRQTLYSGGPPFRNGRTPISTAYDHIVEPVGIQMKATTKDNAIFLLRQLDQILNLSSAPCILAVQGGTNTTYYEISGADVPVLPTYLSEPDGVFRATINWTRSPHGGVSSLTTLLSSSTFGNGSGANANTKSLGAITGDLIYEGMPLNIRFTPSSVAYDRVYAATVSERVKTSVSDTIAGDTSIYPVGVQFLAASGIDVSTLRTDTRLRFRVLARLKTLTNPTKARVWGYVNYANILGQTDVPLPIVTLGANTAAQLIDLGGYPLDTLRNVIMTAPAVAVVLYLSSTDGTSVTATLDYVETLLYYDFASATGARSTSTDRIYMLGAQNLNGAAYLPTQTPQSFVTSSADVWRKMALIRGTLPRAYSGASLYVAAVRSSDNNHTDTDTITVNAQLAPLYRTIRGGG